MQRQDSQSHNFPLEPWRISEGAFDAATNFLGETLFALGNGYIGLRGTHEEGWSGPNGTSLDGTYLNGFYETELIHYPETAYGLAKNNQFMLNVPNGKSIDLWFDDERFDLLQGEVLHYERSTDLRTGIMSRSVEWVSPQGRRVSISSQRLVCFERKHLFAIQYIVKPLNFAGKLRLISALDGKVKNVEAGDDPRVGTAISGPVLELIGTEQSDFCSAFVHRTRNSGFTLVSAIGNDIFHNGAVIAGAHRTSDRLEQNFELEASEGQEIVLTKFGVYFTSRDYPEAELLARAKEELHLAATTGFDALCAEQKLFLDTFWQRTDIEVAGDDALQQGIRFNQFHLLQSVGRDGKTNIAAKGLTGEGYEGHYFWDTEIYIFPFFLYTNPGIARKLLEFRCSGLDAARRRARQLSHTKGALYPWRTIAGDECSSYFPASTAQYHINADIAYSVKLYTEVTGDDSFLLQSGAEMVLETARIWMGIGTYSERHGQQFCINEVTGPDEYTALVNNNYYTNAMAQMHLRFAADVVERLQKNHPEEFLRISRLVDLELDEPLQWRQAAERMYLPYEESLGIHPQDDGFLGKKVWDFHATPKSHYPLLLNYHPLVIYRHQVCKQADVVLALMLLSDQFTLDDKKRDFDYYEAITTHDSSLSSCIFSIIASEVGYQDKAYDYFMETARLDIDNTHGNTHYGVHTAAMAGTWMSMVYGFAGMRFQGGTLKFTPNMPTKWTHYRFKIFAKNSLLEVFVNGERAEYRLLEGDELQFQHFSQSVCLTPARPTHIGELSGSNLVLMPAMTNKVSAHG